MEVLRHQGECRSASPRNPESAKLDLLLAEMAEIRTQTARLRPDQLLPRRPMTSDPQAREREAALQRLAIGLQEIGAETHQLFALDRVDNLDIHLLANGGLLDPRAA